MTSGGGIIFFNAESSPVKGKIRRIRDSDRPWIRALVVRRWGSEIVVTRGRAHRPAELSGLVAHEGERRLGLLTCRFEDEACEIVTLDAVNPGRGVGTALLDGLLDIAVGEGVARIWLVTTNDNFRALDFYRGRGFSLAAVHRDALDESRKIKPLIPLVGIDGIPLRDEIELERRI